MFESENRPEARYITKGAQDLKNNNNIYRRRHAVCHRRPPKNLHLRQAFLLRISSRV